MNGIAISVIIPTLNEQAVIEQCLTSLTRQTLSADQFEVIIVDNGSVDRTLEIARKFSSTFKLIVLHRMDSYISALRNLGAASANGSFLAFLDADCVAPEEWLRQAVGALQFGSHGIVGAFYAIPPGSSWVARAWYGDQSRLRVGRVSYVPSGTMFISRELFSLVGGFDEALQTAEDYEFCQRVSASGYPVEAMSALSTVHLGTPQSVSAFYRKQRWHGNGVRTASLRDKVSPGFGKTLFATKFTLFLMITTMLAIPIAVITNSVAILAAAPSALVFVALILTVHDTAKRRQPILFVPLLMLYLVYGIARAVSFVGFRGKRPNRRSGNSCTLSRSIMINDCGK